MSVEHRSATFLFRLRDLLRFSLRTLILFALLVGSSATLWWNWGPWGVERVLRTDEPVDNAKFSDDDAYMLVGTTSETRHQVGTAVFDARSGAHIRTFWMDAPPLVPLHNFAVVSEKVDPYIHLTPSEPDLPDALFDFKTGARIAIPWRSDWDRGDHTIMSETSTGRLEFHGEIVRVATKWPGGAHFLKRLDLTPLPDWLVDKYVSPSGKYAITWQEHRLAIARIPGGEIVSQIPFERSGTVWSDDDFLNLTNDDLPSPTQELFDPLSGKRFFKSAYPPTLGCLPYCPATGKAVVWDAQQNAFLATQERPERTPLGKVSRARFSPRGTFLLLENQSRVVDGHIGATVWSESALTLVIKTVQFWRDEAYLVAWQDTWLLIYDASTGRRLFALSTGNGNLAHAASFQVSLAHASDRFALIQRARSTDGTPGSALAVQIWNRNRPLAWYGPACLPDFWFTLLLGASFVWSAWRERRTLRAATNSIAIPRS